MCEKRYIGYHMTEATPSDPSTQTCPVSTARTADEAQSIAGIRTLLSGISDGYISVQDRTDDVTEAEYLELERVLNKKFGVTS